MIETWHLPGPAALVAKVVADLDDGRQCLLYGAPPSGFRRAVEDVLGLRQIQLRVIYDDPQLHPSGILRREAALGVAETDDLPAGTWWVDGVVEERAAAWTTEAERMAERARGAPPSRRPLLAIPLPAVAPRGKGLNVVEHQAEPLGQIDLEVAARYAGATAGESGPLGRLRIEMAVEMASGRLPQTDALEMLDRWMAAPDAVLGDPRRFAEYATAVGIEVAHPVFELWRAQHAALLRDIERLRLQIVQAHSARWRMPHLAPEADGRPPKTVLVAEHLELKHLCAQLRQAGEPPRSQLRRSLEALRDLRNTLSHLEPASLAEIELLGRIYTMLSIRAD